jgi:hypothetical protein
MGISNGFSDSINDFLGKIFLKSIKTFVRIRLIFTNVNLCTYCRAHISLNRRERRLKREEQFIFPVTPVGAGALF